MSTVLPVAASARPPVAEPPTAQVACIERRGFDSYTVTLAGVVIGFVDVVGRVHVASQGSRYDRAVEIAQVLDLASAVQRLVAAAA